MVISAPAAWPLWALAAAMLAATALVAGAGVAIAPRAARLAERTGLGEALIGAVFLGATTSLPGIVVSVTAAAEGRPALAGANALGGIAAQTCFLAVADFAYRKANLEHAAASVPNLVQGTLLVGLLALVIAAIAAPPVAVAGVHPVSLGLVAAWAFGLRIASQTRGDPMWRPTLTALTRTDLPGPRPPGADWRAWLAFAGLSGVLASAGWSLAHVGGALADRTWLSDSAVGLLFTAVATSLPELVISVAAARRGSVNLAVGAILGGNAFDVLLLAFADVAYRPGSLYHALPHRLLLVVGVTQLMTAVLLLGMLRRERHGPANVGFESVAVLAIYLGSLPLLATAG